MGAKNGWAARAAVPSPAKQRAAGPDVAGAARRVGLLAQEVGLLGVAGRRDRAAVEVELAGQFAGARLVGHHVQGRALVGVDPGRAIARRDLAQSALGRLFVDRRLARRLRLGDLRVLVLDLGVDGIGLGLRLAALALPDRAGDGAADGGGERGQRDRGLDAHQPAPSRGRASRA